MGCQAGIRPFRSAQEPQRVDDFVAVKALSFNKIQQCSKRGRNEIKTNHLESSNFRRVQQDLESGSGPRWSEVQILSPRPIFQTLEHHFWFSVYTDAVDFVTVPATLHFLKHFRQELQSICSQIVKLSFLGK